MENVVSIKSRQQKVRQLEDEMLKMTIEIRSAIQNLSDTYDKLLDVKDSEDGGDDNGYLSVFLFLIHCQENAMTSLADLIQMRRRK